MQTDAQKRAKKKYDAKTYKSIACKCKWNDYNQFVEYAKRQDIESMNRLIYIAIKYCIENNIDLKEFK